MATAPKSQRLKLAALFVAIFDDITGQTISWSRSVDGLDLAQLEFAALPSGLHLVAEDTFSFTHQSFPGLASFRNHELNEEELREANRLSGGRSRGRRMRSIGVVLADVNAHGEAFSLTETLGQLHVSLEAAEGGSKLVEDDSDVYGEFERLWKTMRSERGIDTASKASSFFNSTTLAIPHPLLYLPTLFQVCGPSVMTLWKYSLSGKRILFYAQPPLQPVCQAAWCTWAIGSPPRSAPQHRPRRYLGNVGLMHMDELKKTDQGGWVASTSDAIYKTRPEMWDLLVDLTDTSLPAVQTADSAVLATLEDAPTSFSPPPVLTRSYINPEGKTETQLVTYTFSDIPLYRSLAAVIATPNAPFSGGLSTVFWSTAYSVFGALYGFCLGVCEFALGRGYTGNGPVHLGPDDEQRGLLSENEDDSAPGPGPLVIHHLAHHTDHLHARLKLLIAQRGPRQLSRVDMSSLGLSVWSALDRAFVEALIDVWELD